jgi:uncharacterized protein YhaN
LARQLERDDCARVLDKNLQEEKAADKKLTEIAEALVLHTAGSVVAAIACDREQTGDSVLLSRIGEIFRALTDGCYDRIVTDMNEADVVRLAFVEREFPDERKTIGELSECTRDQLYLAFRVAAIEEHAATAPPLPFIEDDILQTFDDERALAAMMVVRELSESVQVILLTHHRHLLGIAERLPSGSVHICGVASAAAAGE